MCEKFFVAWSPLLLWNADIILINFVLKIIFFLFLGEETVEADGRLLKQVAISRLGAWQVSAVGVSDACIELYKVCRRYKRYFLLHDHYCCSKIIFIEFYIKNCFFLFLGPENAKFVETLPRIMEQTTTCRFRRNQKSQGNHRWRCRRQQDRKSVV